MAPNHRLYRALGAFYVFGLAATLAVLYAAYRNYVPFDRSNLVFIHPHLLEDGQLSSAFAVASLLWFTSFFVIVLLLARDGVRVTRPRMAAIVAAQVLAGCAFVLLPIAVDSDQFAYAGYAYAAQAANPYAPQPLPSNAPAAAKDVARHWGNPLPTDRYGGGWTLLNAALLRPFENSTPAVQAGILRASTLLASILIALLIASFARGKLGTVVAFALNPLVLLEAANGAHNEIYLVLGGCVAIWLVARARFGLAAIALGLAAAVKFSYAPLIAPLAAYAYAHSHGLRRPILTVAGFIAVIALCSAPFGWRHGPLTAPIGIYAHDHGIVAHLTPLTALAMLAAIVTLTVEARRGRLHAWTLVVTALTLLALGGKLEAWYPLITVPLLAVPSNVTRTAFLAYSALGIVLTQAAFIGSAPLLEAVGAALACATVALAYTTSARKEIPA